MHNNKWKWERPAGQRNKLKITRTRLLFSDSDPSGLHKRDNARSRRACHRTSGAPKPPRRSLHTPGHYTSLFCGSSTSP